MIVKFFVELRISDTTRRPVHEFPVPSQRLPRLVAFARKVINESIGIDRRRKKNSQTRKGKLRRYRFR